MNFQRLLNRSLIAASLAIVLGFFVSLPIGCAHRLELGGAYAPTATNELGLVTATQAPDYGFFIADTAFLFAYNTFTIASDAERNNRALLFQVAPEIKHTLDGIRPKALEAVKRYLAARKVYLANPTPAGLTDLQTILAEVQNASIAAQAALPKPK